ncbi:AAA domain-containing protein [Microlunatus sagamiharensis]|uniref:AAA domain-containing protein n=1 Tax=Microlunatus sagamiharensis TaxID=546874 RepID=A0A1H2LQJ2_9ACTN|nr:AAA family ATPase [Microlunatus sagamiharensis]SDU82861.1 AAA domain-containing protein [Microlunatus sagamiharensis]
MATLLHLNGPPGIGKSTLASLWADRHPGTLDLDIDQLHPLIGGWRDPGQDTHALARPLGKALAASHLGSGHDVVMPQNITRLSEVEAFEEIAHARGADFREVVLLDDRDAALARFETRTDDSAWNRHNREVVAALGGADFLGAMYDALLEVLAARPGAVVLRSTAGAVEETYAALERALA